MVLVSKGKKIKTKSILKRIILRNRRKWDEGRLGTIYPMLAEQEIPGKTAGKRRRRKVT